MTDDARGVVFPLTDGRRSSSATGRAVIADAVREHDAGLAATVEAETDWRGGYIRTFRRLTELSAQSPELSRDIAARGLASARERFRYVRVDDSDGSAREEWTLDEVLGPSGPAPTRTFFTATVVGRRHRDAAELSVPYRGRRLTGRELMTRVTSWVDEGIAEASFRDAVTEVVRHPEWLDLRDVTVVVLGAGAELGPVVSLLQWGAHVVAVDLPHPGVWQRLVALARESPGRLSVPVALAPGDAVPTTDDRIAEVAGADLVHDLPELRDWIGSFPGPLTIGTYVYADGADHVRATLAADTLAAAIGSGRPDVSLAYLATPTDVYAVPEQVVRASVSRARQTPTRVSAARRALRLGSVGRLFSPQYRDLYSMADGSVVGLADCLVPQQGPNYALAKRLQRWRAQVERANGRLVSTNVAPATRTRSVLRNRMLAAAYAGAHRYGIEIFDPSTSNTLMAALLVHDLRNPKSLANPATPLDHPAALWWQGALHGGVWRTPYSPRSVLGVAVLVGSLRRGS